jgi:hypothetical protein
VYPTPATRIRGRPAPQAGQSNTFEFLIFVAFVIFVVALDKCFLGQAQS